MAEFDAELWAEIRTAFAAAVGFDMSAAGQDLAFGFACGYSAGRAGRVSLTDVLNALREFDPVEAALAGQHAFQVAADMLAERFAQTAPEGEQ